MTNLSYPFDAGELLLRRKAIKKELLGDGAERIRKKIAVLGGFTTDSIIAVAELFLLNYGIEAEFYQSEYAQFYSDAVFGSPALDAFAPDVIYICTCNRNIKTPHLAMDVPEQQVEQLLAGEYAAFERMWCSLGEKYGCPVIQNNFEMPMYRLLSNRDCCDIHGRGRFISRLNELMYRYAQTHSSFHVCDLAYTAAAFGLDRWFDMQQWYMYKYPMAQEAVPYLSFAFASIVKSLFGKNKKVLSLDLDNTLWGGVIGDDGVDNIELGEETGVGQCYREFQQYIKYHRSLGVLLTVNSKNDRENALAGIAHPDSLLHEDDFTAIYANWDTKDRNLLSAARRLSLGADSFVFVDDNPAEREMVRRAGCGVAVPELTAPEEYIKTLDRNAYFEVTSFSEDDGRRGEMYAANALREELEGACADYGEYLKGLEMKSEIGRFVPTYHQRIAQLTNKSNQFNVTTRRYTVGEIEKISQSEEYIPIYGKLSDKFGDNGVVSVVIGHINGKTLDIELWIMSCRVLKRDMELAMLDSLVQLARRRGLTELTAHYYPTSKNSMVRELFSSFGFETTQTSPEATHYRLDISKYKNKNHVIEVEPEG